MPCCQTTPQPNHQHNPTNRFGEFEKYIFDFLVGTPQSDVTNTQNNTQCNTATNGVGEGLRLKMQTPLYVADALLEAARLRLEGELSSAQAELSALEAVKRQLSKFQVRRWVCCFGGLCVLSVVWWSPLQQR